MARPKKPEHEKSASTRSKGRQVPGKPSPLVVAITQRERDIVDKALKWHEEQGSNTNASQMIRWMIGEFGVEGLKRMPRIP